MSNPRVTITLGRTGQVVKRGGTVSNDARTDNRPSSGSKRSIRERLGNNAESSSFLRKNKRQRGHGNEWSPGNNRIDGPRIGKNDLRLKLMRKKISRGARGDVEQRGKMDLREKLSRVVQAPVRGNMQQHRPEPRESGLWRRVPPRQSPDDLRREDSLRRSYSSWTMDGLRPRSPSRMLNMSRRMSPPRNMDEFRQVASIRSIEVSRSGRYLSNEVPQPSRPSGASPITMKASHETSKPGSQLPPANGIILRSSYAGDQPLTVAGLLNSLGLGKYAINFQAEEVDMAALRQMGDNDLKDMGIPMGPRKKILLAVMPRSKRQPP